MKRAYLIASCILVAASSVFAQANLQTSPPKTKLEIFEAQEGAVVIRGFSKAGEIRGVYGGSVTVTSIEFTNATTGRKEYGIAFDVKEAGQLERENRSFVDYDEIQSLIKGIDYIGKADKTVTKLDDFQADYRTKGDLVISTFSSGGKTMVSVTSGIIGSTQVFFNFTDLPKLRELITNAKANIDRIKSP